jgi:hypothetical protein
MLPLLQQHRPQVCLLQSSQDSSNPSIAPSTPTSSPTTSHTSTAHVNQRSSQPQHRTSSSQIADRGFAARFDDIDLGHWTQDKLGLGRDSPSSLSCRLQFSDGASGIWYVWLLETTLSSSKRPGWCRDKPGCSGLSVGSRNVESEDQGYCQVVIHGLCLTMNIWHKLFPVSLESGSHDAPSIICGASSISCGSTDKSNTTAWKQTWICNRRAPSIE